MLNDSSTAPGKSLSQTKRVMNSEQMQKSNRYLVIRIIKDFGVTSRKELSDITGLTQGAITLIVNDLLKKNLIEETGLILGNNGRRLTGITLIKNRFCTIGVRITNKYFAVGLFDFNSVCIDIKKTPFDVFDDIYNTLNAIKNEIRRYLDMAAALKLETLALAFSLHGQFRFVNDGCIILSDSGYRLNLEEYFSNAFNLPIYYNSGSNFAAYYFCCQRDLDFMKDKTAVIFSVSYSVELAILQDRTIVRGAATIPGAIGHMPVPDGKGGFAPLETLIGTDSVLKQAEELLKTHPESILNKLQAPMRSRDLINAFYENDPVAINVFAKSASVIGYVIGILTDILHPDEVIVSDEVPICDSFRDMIKRSISFYTKDENLYAPQIVFPPVARATKYDITIIGGCMYATNKLLKNGSLLD